MQFCPFGGKKKKLYVCFQIIVSLYGPVIRSQDPLRTWKNPSLIANNQPVQKFPVKERQQEQQQMVSGEWKMQVLFTVCCSSFSPVRILLPPINEERLSLSPVLFVILLRVPFLIIKFQLWRESHNGSSRAPQCGKSMPTRLLLTMN